MNRNSIKSIYAAAVLAGIPVTASASTVEPLAIGMDQPGIPYRWLVEMSGASDFASLARHVGAWSWEDESLFAPGATPVGWTHNADWIKLRLDTPSILTIRLENKGDVPLPTPPGNPQEFAGDNLFPGLTLWSGWDEDGDSSHSFINRGNVDWAEDLSYLGHQAPPTDGDPATRHMIERSFALEPGDYTFVFGGNSESTVAEGRQGYHASFSTAPVPEPGSALLLAAGALGSLCRRTRSRTKA